MPMSDPGSLATRISTVFRSNPALIDHRARHPWLTGSLGDPSAGIWFVGENPSLIQVEKFERQHPGRCTPEHQWSASRGDRLLRDMLIKYGFKDAPWDSPGGWHCYLTNVVKEADYVSHRNDKSLAQRCRDAELWAPVLQWELEQSHPRLVVLKGREVERLARHLHSTGRISMPAVEVIPHYSYFGQRAQGKPGPMHPLRVQAYDDHFARIRSVFEQPAD